MSGPIRRLLVANRGEIARRIIRSAHAMGIDTVAVYAEGDAASPFVAEAGRAVALAGRSAASTYLHIPSLLEAAARTGADAVHPGYGFLSENAAFARAVTEAGLVFVGPPAAVIEALGDKVAAKQAMRAAHVPVLDSVEITTSADAHAGEIASLGFPVLVKAAHGGGGKGMRVVERREDLEAALAGAEREAAAAFGDGRLFVEPYLRGARHIEIQILGDSHGALVHCFERECSIQRRHQKIIEEAPSSALTPELRAAMGEAALRAADAVRYVNAGTVEFLLGDDGRFFFLEVNTRLQVEHPVTEAITGLDLVREQLLVAMGEHLAFEQDDLSITGHAIEARLYAEDPRHGFVPSAGRLEVWRECDDPAVRYDSGIAEGFVVGVEFDPMLAKVIAHAPTRREAAARLALALERTGAHGLRTNRELLVEVLRDEAFLAGETSTAFLDERPLQALVPHGPEATGALDPAGLAEAALVAALAGDVEARRRAKVLASLPSGWRMSVMPPEQRSYDAPDGQVVAVGYRHRRDGAYEVSAGGADHVATIERAGAGVLDCTVDGVRIRAHVARAGDRVFVDVRGGMSVELTERPRFPEPEGAAVEGALVSPMPGTVLSAHVSAGDEVTKGQLLVVVEAMKMEHRIVAPSDGVVRELHAEAGMQVASGDLLVALDEPVTGADGFAAGLPGAGE